MERRELCNDALNAAAKQGNATVVQILLENGADAHGDGG